jgi:O-antigen ligase
MGRQELIVVACTGLLLVGVAWFIQSGRWRERRLLVVSAALLAALAVLSRRVGWGELLVLAAVVGIPVLLLAPRRR